MLTTIAIDPQNFDYDAFAIYIENNLEQISNTYQKETGYKITDMNITTSNSFVIVNYEREHATENRPKDHCFKFISTQLNFDGIYSTDIPGILLPQLVDKEILTLDDVQYVLTHIDYDSRGVVVLEGIYDTQEDAEKQAFDNSRLNIVPRNKPCDVGLNQKGKIPMYNIYNEKGELVGQNLEAYQVIDFANQEFAETNDMDDAIENDLLFYDSFYDAEKSLIEFGFEVKEL